ncbi:hypothetical protein ACV6DN_01715 [Enterobacter asburiae]
MDAYRNDSHNHISNGLLLRNETHTLYDLNHVVINPQTKTVGFQKKHFQKHMEYMKEPHSIFIKHYQNQH